MSKKLAKKFFNNQTTPAESQAVLEWFETSEGKQFLEERIEADRELMERKDLGSSIPWMGSERLYTSIQEEIKKKGKRHSLSSADWLGYAVKAAAAVLVILTAALFTVTHETNTAEQVTEREPVLYQTEEEQHREITLSDGSVIRLNNNSEVIISEDFFKETREVILEGEAYFEVAHNPEKPFIIHAGNSSVEVLGTSFNVKSVSGQENVQVAVVEGKVSFSALEVGNPERSSVILTKGQFGYLDVNENSIAVDEMAIDNYLAWKSGRFIFEELTMDQVCTQLNRIYNTECSFRDSDIRSMELTSNFSNESLEKTLEVISMTLEIGYELRGEEIDWTI